MSLNYKAVSSIAFLCLLLISVAVGQVDSKQQAVIQAVIPTASQADPDYPNTEFPPYPRNPNLRPERFTGPTATPAPTAAPTSSPTPSSTATATPTAQPSPTGTILSDMPLSMNFMATHRGVDTANSYPSNGFQWNEIVNLVGFTQTRGFPTSVDPNENEYENYFSNGQLCPSTTLPMGGDPRYNTDTSGTTNWNLTMNQEETDVAGTAYAGGSSPPPAVAKYIACSSAVNGSNEWNAAVDKPETEAFPDTVNGINGWVALPDDPTQPSKFGTSASTAWSEVIPTPITTPMIGTQVTMDAPGPAGSSCGSNAGQYFMCNGNWIYIWDNSTTGEHVQITSVNKSAGTITFTPQAAHAGTAILTVDIPWAEAEWQYAAFLYIRHNTTHPEFNGFSNLSTIAFSAIYSTSNGSYGPVSSVDEAFQQQNGGNHLWSVGSGETSPYSDSLHYHTGTCAQFPLWGTGSSNYWHELTGMNGQLGVTTYPWQQSAWTGENIFMAGPTFGDGSAIPYAPLGTSQCDLPEHAIAQQVGVAPYVAFQTLPWAYEMEPGPFIGWDNPLNNGLFDAAFNPFMGTYVIGNAHAMWVDPTTGSAPLTALNYVNPNPVTYCTVPPSYAASSTTTTFGPTNCNWFHALGQSADGTMYTMAMQQMPAGGLVTIPTSGTCSATPGAGALDGACPNQTPPALNAVATAVPWSTTIGNGMKQVKVYQYTDICNAPTRSVLPPTPVNAGTPSPLPTSTPNITVAANTECGDFALIGTYTTTNPTWISISVTPTYTVPQYYLQMTSTPFSVAPLPTVTAVPLVTPLATPTGAIYNRCFNLPCSPNITTLTGT